MRMDKGAILASMVIIMVASVFAGAGTMAYFSDNGKAAITFRSGTVNLQLSKDGENWYDGLSFSFPSDWAPGDDPHTIMVYTRNMGTTGSKSLWVTGGGLKGPNNGFADVIIITDIGYTDRDKDHPAYGFIWVHPGTKGQYYRTIFGDQDSNEPLTLAELASGLDKDNKPAKMNFCWGGTPTDPYAHGDYLPSGGARVQQFLIEFTFDADAGNEYQGKTVGFDLVFRATDEPGSYVWYPPY